MLYQVGQSFNCPKCRKALVFKTEKSSILVCPQCRVVHRRLGLSVADGPFAEPAREDMSIIKVGSTGSFEEKPFEVVGRIQYFFHDSYRNHWYLCFSNGESGWLGDWAGNFSILRELNSFPPENFRKISAGKKVELLQKLYEVEKLDKHQVTLMEGEIPDLHLNEKEFITVYLTQTSGAMALANVYKKENERNALNFGLFAGFYIDFSVLNLQNLREYHDWQ